MKTFFVNKYNKINKKCVFVKDSENKIKKKII